MTTGLPLLSEPPLPRIQKEQTEMSFSTHYLPAVLLTILSLPISLWAQTAPRQSARAPRGSISGRVTIKEKGAPGVVVALRKSGEFTNPFESLPRATTDQDGYYRIANVAAGTYEVSPSAPAFVSSDSKERRGKSVLVGEDENIESINFSLVRGGVITGRVTDADGRSVIQQQVYIYRAEAFEQQQTSQRAVLVTTSVPTDDRGIYRAFGLPSGRYKVAVGLSDDIYNSSFVTGRALYKQVFHPDVSDQTKATVIEVGEGTEAANIDITLGRAMQTFSVAGRLVDGEKGVPVPNLRLGLRRIVGQRFDFAGSSTTTNANGDFVVEGLLPGKYVSFLFQNQTGMLLESLTFEIIDQDLSGLTLKLSQGASVSGVVVLETENKAALAKLSELQLRAYVMTTVGGSGLTSSASSPIAPDGGFVLSGLPAGRVNMSIGGVTTPFPPKGFNISRIERDGIPGRDIDVKEGEQLTGVRVVVGYGSATLRGVVNIENGTLPEGARIFVRLARPGENVLNMAPPQVDARGHFMVDGLAAGTYEVHASITGILQRTVRREINVQDGGITDVTLTIDMSALPQKP
jgi:hypothetical protein